MKEKTTIFNRTEMKEKRRALRNNMTRAEVILWQELRKKKMSGCRFLRQYSVDHYILDFYCPKLKLAIEVDGDSHYKDGAKEYDDTRQRYIESIGIQFLRFTNQEVYQNLDGVCKSIGDKIASIFSKQKIQTVDPAFGLSRQEWSPLCSTLHKKGGVE